MEAKASKHMRARVRVAQCVCAWGGGNTDQQNQNVSQVTSFAQVLHKSTRPNPETVPTAWPAPNRSSECSPGTCGCSPPPGPCTPHECACAGAPKSGYRRHDRNMQRSPSPCHLPYPVDECMPGRGCCTPSAAARGRALTAQMCSWSSTGASCFSLPLE